MFWSKILQGAAFGVFSALFSMQRGSIHLTWEKGIEGRIRNLLQAQEEEEPSRQLTSPKTTITPPPIIIGIAGIPGSGKTTSSQILVNQLSDVGCMLMPMDGYHFSVDQLEAFPNAADAIYRRGAPDTFDSAALVRDLERIRNGVGEKKQGDTNDVVRIPGFDHAKGDPEDGAHEFRRECHRVVVCEGLYLLLDDGANDPTATNDSDSGRGREVDCGSWSKVADYFDLSVFVEADTDECMARLRDRNKCIPGYTPEEIEIRVDAVDRVNAETVQRTKRRADVVVRSAAASRHLS